jgi:hypothetical protein
MIKLIISLMIVAIALMGCAALERAVSKTETAPTTSPEAVTQAAPSPEAVTQAAPSPEAVTPAAPSPEIVPPAAPRPPAFGEKPPELVPGAKYVYKRTNCITGDSQISVSTIKSKVIWMGTTPAYVVELSKQEGTGFVVTSYLIINNELNTLAILDKEGKLLQAIKGKTSATTPPQATAAESDCIKTYDWPLTFGKNFTAEYEIITKPDNNTYKITDQVSVGDELVPVKLPIGDFTTYKIHRITPGSVENHYFAPEIGIEVKQGISQTLDNPAGPGAFVLELIGYNIPGVGQAGQMP